MIDSRRIEHALGGGGVGAGERLGIGRLAELQKGAGQARLLEDPIAAVGLRVVLAIALQLFRELLSLLESGGLDGLSIGFRTVSAAREKLTRTRQLLSVDLWEVSLVTFPMLAGARVSELKLNAFAEAAKLFQRATQHN